MLVANIDLSFLWECFAIASGIPRSRWQVDPGCEIAAAQPDKNRSIVEASMLRKCTLTAEEGNHEE